MCAQFCEVVGYGLKVVPMREGEDDDLADHFVICVREGKQQGETRFGTHVREQMLQCIGIPRRYALSDVKNDSAKYCSA